MTLRRKQVLILILCLIGARLSLQAQDSTGVDSSNQSARSGFVERMQEFAAKVKKEGIADRQADKAAMLQDELVENIKKTKQRARTFLKNGIDTVGISEDLVHINNWHTIAGDGIFTGKGSVQTFRNLTSSYNLLLVLEGRLLKHKAALDNFQHRLSMFRFQIDSLASDSAMFQFSTDSLTLLKYLQTLVAVAHEVGPVDSALKKAIADVHTLQTNVNIQVYKISSSKDEIELYQREIYRNTFSQEIPDIWSPATHTRPLSEIANASFQKGWLTLRFYTVNNTAKVFLLLLLWATSLIYLRSLKNIYVTRNMLNTSFAGQLVLRYPALSSVVVIFNVFQFLFLSPPFLFSAVLWLLSGIALTFVMHQFISRYWMRFWIVNLLLFLLACMDNALLLQASRNERWIMLLLAVAAILFNMFSLWKGDTKELREKWIVYAIGLTVILEVASVVTNCVGRYNLAKGLFVSGALSLVIAIMFLWTVRLINEALRLAFLVYSGQSRNLFYLNFQRVGDKAPVWFYFCMLAGWLVLFGRNFYAFELLAGPVKSFLTEDRSVGDYTFSINTLLLFIVITGISVVISRIVSYFASDKHLSAQGSAAVKDQRAGIGSWLLLIRIVIIGLGLFLAFAAAGIPMDKVAIILGALGVGIGFGLQTLVNNLVSGLIIAFEKPVNVGDVVEIDNQSGTMKSIGFRSSVISTWDGADMVMPNGDLLNSHLVNWSSGGRRRRMILAIGLAYDTDLNKARSVLTAALAGDERILKYPASFLQFQEFGTNGIEVKLFFWSSYGEGAAIKGDLIVAIQQAFQANGIVIPYPQQDIHISGMPAPDNKQ